MASPYAIDDSKPLAEVLSQAIAPAGLSADDEPVQRAKQALAQQLFVNAYTLRFKRQRTGDWNWLQREPFSIPMCLADLIGYCLDQKTGMDGDDRNGSITYLPCNAALKFLLSNTNLDTAAAAAAAAADLAPSNGSSTPNPSVNQTPTLAAIRLGQLDEPIDFARHLALLDDDIDLVEKRSRSESPRGRRSIPKSRNPKKFRSGRHSKPSMRQTNNARPSAAPEPSPEPAPPLSQHNDTTMSPVIAGVVTKDAQAIRDQNRIPRRSIRDSALVKALINTLDRVTKPVSFSINMIQAISVMEDDQSSCDSDSSSGSDFDLEGRRRSRRSTRSTPVKEDGSVNGRDYTNSSSKRRELERSRQENQFGNGISPKRKRINYSSDR